MLYKLLLVVIIIYNIRWYIFERERARLSVLVKIKYGIVVINYNFIKFFKK